MDLHESSTYPSVHCRTMLAYLISVIFVCTLVIVKSMCPFKRRANETFDETINFIPFYMTSKHPEVASQPKSKCLVVSRHTQSRGWGKFLWFAICGHRYNFRLILNEISL